MAYAYDQENLTVANTAIPLTKAVLFPTGLRPASEALLTVENQPIRYTVDGTTPVGATTGHYAEAGTSFRITGIGNLQQFLMIRDGGSSAVVDVTYFR